MRGETALFTTFNSGFLLGIVAGSPWGSVLYISITRHENRVFLCSFCIVRVKPSRMFGLESDYQKTAFLLYRKYL